MQQVLYSHLSIYETLSRKLGERLRKIRLGKGMSQGDITRKLGVRRSYISGIERDTRNPTVKNIEKLADALDINASELFKS